MKFTLQLSKRFTTTDTSSLEAACCLIGVYMTELLSIIYVSSAVKPFTDTELEELLVDARSFNKAHALTGVLLYAEGNFLQYLEGPLDAVTNAYARIQTSHRHKGLIELNRAEIHNRSFASWEMGLLQPDKTEFISILNALSLMSAKDCSSAIAIEFMKSFIATVGVVKY